MPDVSIAISVKDNFSDAITTMRNANQSFNKDLTGTMEKLDRLNETKYQLKVDTDKARDALKAAEKQYNATGDAADKMSRDMAAADYDKAKRNLNLVSKNARQAENDIVNMTGAVEKADNRAGRVSAIKESGNSGLLSRLAAAGFTKMAGDTLSTVAQTYITSAFSNETGNAVSSVLGGITNGAAMGSTFGLPGAAIGAAAGAASGAIEAATKTFSDKDNYFKSAVQDQYNTIKNTEQSDLTSGISSASEREGDLRAFTSLLDGNTKSANKFQKSLIEIGRTPPFSYPLVSQLSKEMLGLGDSTDEVTKKINDLGEVAAAENWSSGTVESVNAVLNQTLANGQVSSRVLKTLDRYGLHAEDAIAQAFHMKTKDVASKISKLDATKVVDALYNYMGTKFKGSSTALTNTYEGQKGIAESYEEDRQVALGTGYDNARTPALKEHNKMMSGAIGKDIQEANSMLGKFKADLDNTKEELIDNAESSIVSGKVTGKYSTDKKQNAQIKKQLQTLANDYKQQRAKAAKGDKEAAKKQAEDVEESYIIAQNAYKLSKGYQLEEQGNLDLIKKIQGDDALNTAYYDAGYHYGQRFSKGIISGANYNSTRGLEPSSTIPWVSSDSTNGSGKKSPTGLIGHAKEIGLGGMASHATGINRVPYNNYATLLHEDERVLTGAEARSQKNQPGVVITGNTFNVRKESDIDEIASKLYRKLKMADAITP